MSITICTPIRQEYLEKVLKWISDDNVQEYMATHQHDDNASGLWQYFRTVVNWVETTFPVYRKEMKGLDWGRLYNLYHEATYNAQDLEEDIQQLMQDEDVTNKRGIYEYLLTWDTKFLNIRAFPESMKREAYERQKGICAKCGEHFEMSEMEADHITPWKEGGKTAAENCQMLCRECNRRKSDK